MSFIFSNTFLAFCLGTSTKVYLSYISIVPTNLPGIPTSPAIAPNISLAWTLWFLPTFINSLIIPSLAPVSFDLERPSLRDLDGSSTISCFSSSPKAIFKRAAAISTTPYSVSDSEQKFSNHCICLVKWPASITSLTWLKNVFTFFSSTSATDGISCLINFVLVYLSISLIFLISFPNTNENDIPLLPALPVLPILCT